MTLDFPLMMRDGAILAVLASAWVMGALYYNPRLFLRHYPREIRDAAAPLSDAERQTSKLVGLPFLVLLLGFPIYSTVAFESVHPQSDFLSRFAHGAGVSMFFNIIDFVVLDLFWLGLLRPRWAMIPGTETVQYRFNTLDHVRGFVSGTVLAVIVGLLGAGFTLLL